MKMEINFRIPDKITVRYLQRYLFLVIVILYSSGSFALNIKVVDQTGKVVTDAVVSVAVTESLPNKIDAPEKHVAVMDQINTQFVPFVLPVQKGTYVNFPNSDNIRHHVYSFSTPKVFQIKLYSGTPVEPVFFDQAGVVVLGCNIHDVMRGYIYVLDTPHFSKTDANGLAILDYRNEAEYQLEVWHPDQERINVPAVTTIKPAQDPDSTIEVTVKLKQRNAFRAPQSDLEKKFQSLRKPE